MRPGGKAFAGKILTTLALKPLIPCPTTTGAAGSDDALCQIQPRQVIRDGASDDPLSGSTVWKTARGQAGCKARTTTSPTNRASSRLVFVCPVPVVCSVRLEHPLLRLNRGGHAAPLGIESDREAVARRVLKIPMQNNAVIRVHP